MSTDLPPTSAPPLPDATATLPDDPVILQQMVLELLDVLRRTRARTSSSSIGSISSSAASTARGPNDSTPISRS